MSFRRNIGSGVLFNGQMTNNLFLKEIFNQELINGRAFLTIRNKEATIYYNGNQLCNMAQKPDSYEPHVYSKYLPLLRSEALRSSKGIQSISENEWLKRTCISGYTFGNIFPEILDNIEKESDPEGIQVSNLYKFSLLNKDRQGDIILLDVEAAFAASGAKTERIDVVLYHMVKQQLIFVEVKRLSDGRIRDKNGVQAEVLSQLNGYQQILENRKNIIVQEYNNVISFYNNMLRMNIKSINNDCKLLLGLLLVEFTSSKADQEQKELVEKMMIKNNYGFYSVGDTKNITEKSLEALYKAFL